MATVAEEPPIVESAAWTNDPEQRFLIFNVPWDGYEMMLKLLDERPIRVTYDRGTLELMSPSIPHEEVGRLLGILIQAIAEELDLPCLGLKSTTWKRRLLARGIEADESFYLANTGLIVAKGKKVDLEVDPPPDLCIEVEITKSALKRMGIYAALGVPEVWRHDGTTLRVAVLRPDGTYAERDSSPSFPFLPLAEVVRLVAMAEGMDHSRWGRQVRAWVREVLVPLHRPPGGGAG